MVPRTQLGWFHVWATAMQPLHEDMEGFTPGSWLLLQEGKKGFSPCSAVAAVVARGEACLIDSHSCGLP